MNRKTKVIIAILFFISSFVLFAFVFRILNLQYDTTVLLGSIFGSMAGALKLISGN